MGHAVPMPVVVKTTEYGEAIYAQYAMATQDIKLRKDTNNLKSDVPFG